MAARFLDAAGSGDTETACTLLVPKTREDLAFSDRSLDATLDRIQQQIEDDSAS